MFDGTEDWCKEGKMVELNQNKNPKQLDSLMQWENFILPYTL